MKKLFTFILLTSVYFSVQAQFTGKPIYNIRVDRADTVIGNIVVELFPNIAPLHVANFDSIVNLSGFDSSAFHRVISGFMIQGGELVPTPSTNNVNAEFSEVPHDRGVLSAARAASINSATSQFFICHAGSYWLDGDYSVYGETTSGIEVVDIVANAPTNSNDAPLDRISMYITRIGSNDSVPAAPSLVSPADAVTGVTTAQTFTWASVPGAKLYLFEVATDTGFTNVVYSRETKNLTSTMSGLTNSYADHYWRVRANNGGHYSVGGEVRTFENLLGVPMLLLPIDGSASGTRPVLDWTDVSQADEYHVEISKSSNFGNPILTVVDTIVTASQMQPIPHLQKSLRHYWRVTAKNATDDSDASEVFDFLPNTTSEDYDAVKVKMNNNIVLYPNPAGNVLNVEVKELSNVRVFDTFGRLLLETQVSQFNQSIEIDNLHSGFYVIQLSNNSGTAKGSFIKK